MARPWEMDDAPLPSYDISWCALCDSFCVPFPHCMQHMAGEYCSFRLVYCDPVGEDGELEVAAA